ncbi:MAG: hypothetical protein ABSE18_03490 [Minisyncoccia bacterium]
MTGLWREKAPLFLFIAFAMFVLCLRAALPVRADGFGITPPYVTNGSLVQNSHYEQAILLVRSNPTQDLRANISIDVPGADSWISIDRGTQFTMPTGVQQVPILVSVNVPSDAKLGHYVGNIRVVVSPLAPPTSGTIGITIGAQIDVDLQVIDSRMAKLKVNRVAMTNTEEGHSFWWMHFPGKVLFTMDVENTGNIPGSPHKVVFQYDEYLSGTTLETEENTNGLDSVRPFQRKEVVAEMPTYLPQGSYRVFYKIYGKDDGDVIGQGMLDLAVLPPGTLTGYSGYGFWGLKWNEKAITFGIAVLILAFLYGVLRGIRRLIRKKRSSRHRDRVYAPPPSPNK